ncbi:MAG: D-alanine--D-alanine ligase [Oscillospiraceae bacterium]|nr:D-alanine--D-alanine ligase [Oscillospiraceae bacterium]
MSKKTVAVLFGGRSSEYEVSLLSAASVLDHIPSDRYDAVTIGITKEGRWLWYGGPSRAIADGNWKDHPSNRPVVFSLDPSQKGILKLDGETAELLPVDCIFPVLHGKNGEDGTVQGMLDLAGIPYVGCGLAASANCMDKQFTHTILDAAGIRTAKWRVLRKAEHASLDSRIPEIEEALGYPVFVKPANAGSSVGISKAHNREELKKALELAFVHDEKAILEETITGTEVECAVLGNEAPKASQPGQITPSNEFYDYNAKYIDGASKLDIPAKISPEVAELVKETAIKAYRALGCSGLSRVDFFVTDSGEVILNEINTLPGFTDISMYPKLWEAQGVPYTELVSRLIELALERKEDVCG